MRPAYNKVLDEHKYSWLCLTESQLSNKGLSLTQVLFMQFKVWGRRVEDLCKMLPGSIHCHYFIHAGLLHAHHELVQWRGCCCLQMKTSVFCLLLPLHFLSAYFAEMSFPPILSNLVHKEASVKWAYISPNDTIRLNLSQYIVHCQRL